MRLKSKAVIIAGPHGAGKESLGVKVESVFGFRRLKQYTTRPQRKGESPNSYLFVDEDEFRRIQETEGMLTSRKNYKGDLFGVTERELFAFDWPLYVTLDADGARAIRDRILECNGKVRTIFVHATLPERRRRLRKLYPDLSEEEFLEMLNDEPSPSQDLSLYRDFNLVIENPDGKLLVTSSQVNSLACKLILMDKS